MMSIEQDYSSTKAALVWRRAGGSTDADLTALAAWARAAHAADKRNVGIVVDETGQIAAQTVCIQAGGRELKVWYVDQCAEVPEVNNEVLDLAMTRIEHVRGRRVVHFGFWELCQGAAR